MPKVYRAAGSKTSRVQRHRVRRGDIVAALRAEISKGKFNPGDRLPTQIQLQERFHTTPVTIQRAMRKLKQDGLIRSQEGVGFFVADRPPQLTQFAMTFPAFPDTPEGHFWSRLYAALINEAMRLSEQGGCEFQMYYGLESLERSPDYTRLVERVREQRLAGIFFAHHPYPLWDSPLVTTPNIPRVALMGPTKVQRGIPGICVAGDQFFERGVDWLAARGRRRVAFLGAGGPRVYLPPELIENLNRCGATMHPRWAVLLHPDAATGANSVAQLLMQGEADARPDALIIGDDNLVEDTVKGLVAAKIRVGEELDVVAHCNFPWVGARPLPIRFLGYDTRQMLLAALDVLQRQRRGEEVPPLTMIDAVFEEELSGGREAAQPIAHTNEG
jgi:DNA-binding LacI/PurR family transcriptional regulator